MLKGQWKFFFIRLAATLMYLKAIFTTPFDSSAD